MMSFDRVATIQDVFGCLGSGSVISAIDEAADGGGELFNAGEVAATDGLVSDDADDLRAVRAEHVQVHSGLGEPQAPVLMEGRLSNGEDIAQAFERGDIRVLIPGVGDCE